MLKIHMKLNTNSYITKEKVLAFNDSKAFSEYSNHMGDIYKNIDEYN